MGEPMNWCCTPFKSWYEAAGERGFAVLVGRARKLVELANGGVDVNPEQCIQWLDETQLELANVFAEREVNLNLRLRNQTY